MPRLHERTKIVQRAGIEIADAFSRIAQKYDLTFGETVRILSDILASEAKGIIRQERHGDNPDDLGGDESAQEKGASD